MRSKKNCGRKKLRTCCDSRTHSAERGNTDEQPINRVRSKNVARCLVVCFLRCCCCCCCCHCRRDSPFASFKLSDKFGVAPHQMRAFICNIYSYRRTSPCTAAVDQQKDVHESIDIVWLRGGGVSAVDFVAYGICTHRRIQACIELFIQYFLGTKRTRGPY